MVAESVVDLGAESLATVGDFSAGLTEVGLTEVGLPELTV